MQQLILTDDSGGYLSRVTHHLTPEGGEIIYGAYESLYGTSQSRERLMERGGLFVTEIDHFIERGSLPKGFDWTKYINK